ncbi:acetyl-CoA synthetase-like protein [Nadsonia fulvescens var. elongata DSM 6958]|uniref:Very long-chain fatty acid transport protein n=1 Tax=Nadsonia fulvescens var. elongata DSM 6958 TaxID=857566 RepID=A0A1E3PG20_9ASCO|nr:acetyl-CoA synthetase-like protein [Nadsonia fulvescens var. elongata DSM 6958]
MSILSLAAGATMGAAYLEAKALISEDFLLIRKALQHGIDFVVKNRQGKNNYWYLFEYYALNYPQLTAIIYPRPVTSESRFKTPEEEFIIEKYTYGEVYNTILKYAYVLKEKHGVTPDQVIALNAKNSPEFVFVWFAIWSLGATPAFINYNLTNSSLIHCIKIGEAALMLVDNDAEVRANVEPCIQDISEKGNCTTIFLDKEFQDLVQTSPAYRAPNSDRHPEHQPWDTAILIYTSGTTGLPKPGIMSWRKANLASALYGSSIRLKRGDTVYSAMPLYHSTASVLGLLPCFSRGATYSMGNKFSTRSFWTQVKLTGASHIQYVGETCRYLYNSPKTANERSHKVRVAFGNGMRKDIWAKFKERFNIPAVGEFYASTEGPLGVNNFQTGDYGIGAVGKYGALVSWALKFQSVTAALDPEDENELWRDPKTGLGRKCRPGEPGEFLQLILDPKKAHQTFQGYKNDSNATNKKIVFDLFKKGDAWYRSGDIMKFGEDDLVYFVDRLGDTFRWKSENVSTNEVEEVISQSAGVDQCVVVGVKVPNHEGRAGFAVIALTPEYRAHPEKFNFEELANNLRKNLPKYAIPLFIKFVNAIQTTPNNKIQKKLYRSQVLPKGENEKEVIFWLSNGSYTRLEQNDWDLISSGKSKL